MSGRGERTWVDRTLSAAFGAAVALLAWFTGNNAEIPPELWGDIAVAAGIRPPAQPFPFFWTSLASLAVARDGLPGALDLVRLAGPVALGVLAAVSCGLFAGFLPPVLRDFARRTRRGRWIARGLVLVGATLFVCSEPVWRAGRILSPEMTLLFLTAAVLRLGRWSVESSRPCAVLLTGAASGVLAAETPIGFLPPVALALIFHFRNWSPVDEPPPLANPLVRTVTFRRLVWMFATVWLLAVVWNMRSASALGAVGSDAGAFVVFARYLRHYAGATVAALSPAGWLFLAMIAVAPLVYAAVRLRAATDVDRFFQIRHAFFYLIAGGVCVLQSSAFPDCWFWRWTDGAEPVRSAYLLALCLLGTALTAFLSLCVWMTEIFFRNNRRIAAELLRLAGDEGETAALRVARSVRGAGRMLRPVVLVALPTLVLPVLPRLFDSVPRAMASVVNDAARLTAAECGDAALFFTDGALDAAVECAAAAADRPLKTLSLMSGSSPYDVALRTRGVTDEEDRDLLTIGAADALRTWVRAKAPCVSNVALQVGFELWRHDRLPMPPVGGFVARTAGFGAEGPAAGIASARALAERVLAICEKTDPFAAGYPKLNALFSFVQWRLSRMCRMRANAADGRADAEASAAEHALADRLDAANPQWRQVQERMDWIGRQGGMRLTPREGLRLGLDRADFRLARSYARQILATAPDDVAANFAMGMSCFVERQYGRAEQFLKRAREKSPDEPAILNNLAVVLLRLDRYAEAETNAVRALKAFPASTEIKETLRRIRQAREKK